MSNSYLNHPGDTYITIENLNMPGGANLPQNIQNQNLPQQIVQTQPQVIYNQSLPSHHVPSQYEFMENSNRNYNITKTFNKNWQENQIEMNINNSFFQMLQRQPSHLNFLYPALEYIAPNLAKSHIYSLAECIQEGSKMSILGCIAMLITSICAALRGRIITVCNSQTNWKEPAILWCLNLAMSGIGKSITLNKIEEPFKEFEKNHNNSAIRLRGEAKIMAKKVIEYNRKEIVKKINLRDPLCLERLKNISKQIEESEVYRVFSESEKNIQIIFSKGTEPGLRDVMIENGGAAYYLNAEGIKFFKKCPEYIDLLAKTFYQEQETYRTARGIFSVQTPILSVNIATQTDALVKLFNNSKYIEQFFDAGIFARILPVINPDFGENNAKTITDFQTYIEKKEYKNLITELLNEFYTRDIDAEKFYISLDKDAQALFNIYNTEINNMRPHCEHVNSWLAKAAGGAARTATSCHFLKHGVSGKDKSIDGESMQIAIEIMKCIQFHVDYLFSDTGLKAERNAKEIIAKLQLISDPNQQAMFTNKKVTSSQLQSRLGGLRNPQINDALRFLAERNWCIFFDDGSGNLAARFRPEIFGQMPQIPAPNANLFLN